MVAIDRNEPLTAIEPILLAEGSRYRAELADLALEVGMKAAAFRASLPVGVRTALAQLVRAMNSYYSNLIEGHDTHPVEIERALAGDYSADPEKRNLQLEARAHVAVQRWIDDGGLAGGKATTRDGLCEIHRRFCAKLPDELLWVQMPGRAERLRVEPGELRNRDVQVGRHLAVSPGAVPRFLTHFEQILSRQGRSGLVLAAAAAHHRLLWIHPFLDGNGRVARLMSHALFIDALDTGGVWSISRGLARRANAYKAQLAAADAPRDSDLDGRGALSERALADFTRFFLETALDQIIFMEGLVEPVRLQARLRLWAEEEARLGQLPAKAGLLLDAVLYRGELPRGDVDGILGTGERQARRIVAGLIERGVLVAESSRAPLNLAFPATLASRWMPGLFPEA